MQMTPSSVLIQTVTGIDNLKKLLFVSLWLLNVFIYSVFSSHDYLNYPLVRAIEATKSTVLPPPPDRAKSAEKPPYWDGDWVNKFKFTCI